MLKVILGPFQIFLGVNNIGINSKIWNKVVSWEIRVFWDLSGVESSSESFIELLFSDGDCLCCIKNAFINSKIWNKVVSWIIFLSNERWLSNWNLPWNRSFWWSESDWLSKWDYCCDDGSLEHLLFINKYIISLNKYIIF